MNRDEMLRRLVDPSRIWDLVILGGGATGLGVAVDAASRGYGVLLLERGDFAQGTSSRSTKLIHGGVRYLQQGNVSLVLEALRERGLLQQNAPHLVGNLRFVVPNYEWWEAPFYGIGLKLYDVLAGKLGFGPSRFLSKQETVERLPNLETAGLRGGIIYHDGQFDDARLAISLAQTAVDHGATLVNYVTVTDFQKTDGLITGVVARDEETGEAHRIRARAVVNATGAFSDVARSMDDPAAPPLIIPSQGIHLVLDRSFLPGTEAIMVPHTADGRIVFVIPWYDRVVVGTTDTGLESAVEEPRPRDEEIEFLLETSARYLIRDPQRADIRGVFAGIRPLVRDVEAEGTAAISREHTVEVSMSGLVTIAGGKWTTYRKMAEDTVDAVAAVADLPERPCRTRTLRIHGYDLQSARHGPLAVYGSDAPRLQKLISEDPRGGERLHPAFDVCAAQVVWAVREEMARSVADVLARRTRILLLDTRASLELAPRVAALMAAELSRDAVWVAEQVRAFRELAEPLLIS
jgi:glycerol-3-phosphate dehydrogenase